jgi:acyl-CoA thioester hydrolase
MSIPAPFERYQGEVLREWIDANDHMNLAYYTVLFDYATDALFDAIGIGRQYKDATGNGTFVVETHNLYERELLLGDRVRVSTQIVAMDGKRLHLAHEMFMLANGQRAATQELMYLHVSDGARPSSPSRLGRPTPLYAALNSPSPRPSPRRRGEGARIPSPRGGAERVRVKGITPRLRAPPR